MDIYEIESKDLENYFIDFRNYIKNCEFVGCTHIKEENCGIKEALREGKIQEERYENYLKIYNDLKDKEEHKMVEISTSILNVEKSNAMKVFMD